MAFVGQLLIGLCAFLLMQLILFIFRRRYMQKTFERMKIPSPEANILHGHLYNSRSKPFVQYAAELHKKYGENVGIYLGGDPFLLTTNLDLIQSVFTANSKIFYDRMNFYLSIDPVPHNLICMRGDRWRYMRKVLTPAFTHHKVKSGSFYQDTEATVNKFLKQISELPKEDQLLVGPKEVSSLKVRVDDTYDRMAAIALDVITKTAFDMDGTVDFSGKPDTYLETVKKAIRLAFNPVVELIVCFPFLDGILTFIANKLFFDRIISILFNQLNYLIKSTKGKHRTDIGGSGMSNNRQNKRIIDSLLECYRDNKITFSEFSGNAFVVVFAGFETTANALTFTMWLLATHPDIQDKLRAELSIYNRSDTSANDSHDSKLLLPHQDCENTHAQMGCHDEDMKKMKYLPTIVNHCDYLEMVINESLRLYPPVPALSCRSASTACVLPNGMKIEKGVNILPSVYSIHRDINIWGHDADKFKPERFESIGLARLNSAQFMPFGLGPRNCIGNKLAMLEMKIVIAKILILYRVETCLDTPDHLELCSPINITITCKTKIPLKFVQLPKKY